uniref:Uncharacterized protein n=1 Tax=Arundo donax TaxID=35708 RepID=A0A0A9D3Q4_ARUDO
MSFDLSSDKCGGSVPRKRMSRTWDITQQGASPKKHTHTHNNNNNKIAFHDSATFFYSVEQHNVSSDSSFSPNSQMPQLIKNGGYTRPQGHHCLNRYFHLTHALEQTFSCLELPQHNRSSST